jgi:hypothetical protein
MIYEQILSNAKHAILGLKINEGSSWTLDTFYLADAIRLRDFLDKWIEKEKRKDLTDEDINLLKEVQRKISMVHKELNDAIATIRDRR